LRLLRGGARNSPARHQQLHDTIAWSYALLTPAAQTFFRHLAVFAGGFTVNAAREVAILGGRENTDTAGQELVVDSVALLDGLMEQSLVRLIAGAEGAAAARLAMLESIHAFAQDRLVADDDADAVRDRHAAYFLDLVEQLDAGVVVFLPGGHRVLDQLEVELPNIRLALSRLAETGNGDALLRLAGALDYFWQVRGGVLEGSAWLERALALGHDAPRRQRAIGLLALAGMLRMQGEPVRALPLCRESLELARQAGDQRGIALAAQRCSLLSRQLGAFA
jgi:predicted ATPase